MQAKSENISRGISGTWCKYFSIMLIFFDTTMQDNRYLRAQFWNVSYN